MWASSYRLMGRLRFLLGPNVPYLTAAEATPLSSKSARNTTTRTDIAFIVFPPAFICRAGHSPKPRKGWPSAERRIPPNPRNDPHPILRYRKDLHPILPSRNAAKEEKS